MAAGVFALTNCILVSNSNPKEGESAIRQILLPFLYGRKNKPPALQGEESSLDKRNSCAKINVGLQTTNKKHRRSKGWT